MLRKFYPEYIHKFDFQPSSIIACENIRTFIAKTFYYTVAVIILSLSLPLLLSLLFSRRFRIYGKYGNLSSSSWVSFFYRTFKKIRTSDHLRKIIVSRTMMYVYDSISIMRRLLRRFYFYCYLISYRICCTKLFKEISDKSMTNILPFGSIRTLAYL